ncbi:MAG: HD domain-containing protein [Dechloromonas sp.]|nr:HD domain-containing protein [Dechloromonas sp.]
MPRQRRSIFLIDADPAALVLGQRVFERLELPPPVVFDNPRLGIETFRRQRAEAVLVALTMPGMTGVDVIAELAPLAAPEAIPIVALADPADRSGHERAWAVGAAEILTRPLELAEVRVRLGNLLQLGRMRHTLAGQDALLQQRVGERTRDLEALLEETRLGSRSAIRRLARALDHRCGRDGQHGVRMSKIAASIGHHMGLDGGSCELLVDAAAMHDIGTVIVPGDILHKTGRLSPVEFEQVKRHPLAGAAMLDGDDSRLLQAAREIALTHHENWDGSGYPGGLKGEKVPLFGRIAAVADVFDALTAERPYRRAWPLADAAREIRRLSGSKFDPAVVDAFEAGHDEILFIAQRFVEAPGALQ